MEKKKKRKKERVYVWDFPSGPVVKTPRFQCRRLGSIPGWGTKIPHAMCCGQMNKYFILKKNASSSPGQHLLIHFLKVENCLCSVQTLEETAGLTLSLPGTSQWAPVCREGVKLQMSPRKTFTPSSHHLHSGGLWPAHQGGDAAESSSPRAEIWETLEAFIAWGHLGASPVAQLVKNLPAIQETGIPSLGQEDALEKGMTTHSSILPWEIPWAGESGRLQFIGPKELDMTSRLNHTEVTGGPNTSEQKDRTPRCQTFP